MADLRYCVIPYAGGQCGKSVAEDLDLPLCFAHAAAVWEYCRERIQCERQESQEADDTQRVQTFVAEFAAARQQMAEDYAALQTDPEIDDPDSVVYYLQFADRIKIGFSRNLGRRLLAIPHDELLAVEPGGLAVEQRRHLQFAEYRIVGEWFRVCDPLMEHIQRVKAAESDRKRGEHRMAAAFEVIDPARCGHDDSGILQRLID